MAKSEQPESVSPRFINAASSVASKLESQMVRNPTLPDSYRAILREFYDARELLPPAVNGYPMSSMHGTVFMICGGCGKETMWDAREVMAGAQEALKEPAEPVVAPRPPQPTISVSHGAPPRNSPASWEPTTWQESEAHAPEAEAVHPAPPSNEMHWSELPKYLSNAAESELMSQFISLTNGDTRRLQTITTLFLQARDYHFEYARLQQPTLSPQELAPLIFEAAVGDGEQRFDSVMDASDASDLARDICSIPGLAVVRKKGE